MPRPVAEFSDRVMALSAAAWRLRAASPKPCDLPFALALFSDADRLPPVEELAAALPALEKPLAFIFRHDHLVPEDRLALGDRLRLVVQGRGHLFFMARTELRGADGHHKQTDAPGLLTMPAHDEDELVAAFAAQASAAFLSPIFATRSHRDAKAMGRERAVAIAQASPMPLFALGGMDEEKAAELEGTPFQGFGAIDAFAGKVS